MTTNPPLIPRDVLFGNPERQSPQLSPDGKRLAYLAPRDGVMNVWVRTVGQSDDRPVTGEKTRPLRAYLWAENARQILYAQDKGGDENFHVFLVDLDTGVEKDLTPFPNVQASPVASEPGHPDAVLLQVNARDPQLMDVHRADLTTGELTLVAENPGNIAGWVADPDLRVRAAVAMLPDGGQEILVRDDEAGPWRTLLAFPFGEQGGPAGFTHDGRGLYVLSDKDVNTQRLYLADLGTGGMTLLHAREDVDLGGLLMHPTRHTVQAVGYNRTRLEWVALDPDVAEDLEVLRRAADGDFTIVGRDNADSTWLAAYVRDDGPVTYYTYDRS